MPAPDADPAPSTAEVRDWCLAHGVPVAAKGPIGETCRTAYDTAHQDAR